jgi:hypothetical protein
MRGMWGRAAHRAAGSAIQAAEYKVFAQAAESNLTVCQAAERVFHSECGRRSWHERHIEWFKRQRVCGGESKRQVTLYGGERRREGREARDARECGSESGCATAEPRHENREEESSRVEENSRSAVFEGRLCGSQGCLRTKKTRRKGEGPKCTKCESVKSKKD